MGAEMHVNFRVIGKTTFDLATPSVGSFGGTRMVQGPFKVINASGLAHSIPSAAHCSGSASGRCRRAFRVIKEAKLVWFTFPGRRRHAF